MDSEVLTPIFLSLKVAILSLILVVIVGIPLSYLFATKKFKGKSLMEVLFTLPLVLPPTVTGYYLILILGRGGWIGNSIYQSTGWTIMFTWWAAVLGSFIVSLPLMIQTTQAAIESVDHTLLDSAFMLGYSEWEVTLRVTLPLAKRGIIAGMILSFTRAIGEFGATLMIAGNIPGKTETMPLAIYNLTASGDWSRAHIMVIIMTLLSGSFLFLARHLNPRNP